MIRKPLILLVEKALGKGVNSGALLAGTFPPVMIGVPSNPEHGDYSCNIAMQLAKKESAPPRRIAEIIISNIDDSDYLLEKVEIAGPGFINFYISQDAWQKALLEIERQGGSFGRSGAGEGKKVQVEFVSANPTGPLHIGHGRGAAIGDSVSRLLEATGWDVTREFYYNDAGQQIANLALSVQARCKGVEPGEPGWPVDGYQGEYIKDIASSYLAKEVVDASDQHIAAAGDPDDLEAIRRFSVASLRREQDADLKAFDVRFDVFTLESSLYSRGLVEYVVRALAENGHSYEADGALWLRTTAFGDDKDRVMRKSDGSYTYFVPDIAYHLDKWERGFIRVVNEQGSDHHSTITRVRAGLQALGKGIPEGWPEYLLHQMVTVMRGGEEVKISKRAGSYVTLRDLIDEVGRDAVRFFFIMRKPDAQLVFDLDLAKEQSPENPVYYLQYAHARICSIFENAAGKGFDAGRIQGADVVSSLESPEELEIMKLLSALPHVVSESAANFEPHRLTGYLTDLAGSFHRFYNKSRVISDNSRTTLARLYLLERTAQVFRNALDILGISAPERM